MAVRMGRWNCPKCGVVNIGTDLFCTCGYGRTENDRIYLPKNEPPITDAQKLKEAHAGPNWICSTCRAPNVASRDLCSQCGAPKGSSASLATHDYTLENVPQTAEQAERVSREQSSFVAASSTYTPSLPKETYSSPTPRTPSSSTQTWDYSPKYRAQRPNSGSPFSRGQITWIAAIMLILGACAGVTWLFLHTTQVASQFDHAEWSRTVNIDQFQTIKEEDWSIPSGGRQTRFESRIHHYNHVYDHTDHKTRRVKTGTTSYICGERDNGNGTFSDIECSQDVYGDESYDEDVYRDDPVYANWYFYDIDKWYPGRAVYTNGNTRNDPAPYFGEVVLNCANQAILGCERETGRSEVYVVIFKVLVKDKDPRLYRLDTPRASWDAYEPGIEYTLVLDNFDHIKNDPLADLREKSKDKQ